MQERRAGLSSLDSRITDRNIQLLFRALQTGKCGKLNILRLSNNAMSVAGCKAMERCLEAGSLSELRHIDLQRTPPCLAPRRHP